MENNWRAEWESEVKVSGHATVWMPCWGYSDTQGFGQVQIKSWPQHGSFKDNKLRLARPVKEADEDTLPHMHYLFLQDQHQLQCKLPPASSRDSTAVTVLGDMNTHQPGWDHQWDRDGGCWVASPTACRTAGCWAQLIPINWGISCAPNIWLRQGSKQHFCTPRQPMLLVSIHIWEDG